MRATDGQFVKAGDTIATLDTDPLLVAAAQANAGIESGEAQSAQAADQIPSRADITRGQRRRGRLRVPVQPRQLRL